VDPLAITKGETIKPGRRRKTPKARPAFNEGYMGLKRRKERKNQVERAKAGHMLNGPGNDLSLWGWKRGGKKKRKKEEVSRVGVTRTKKLARVHFINHNCTGKSKGGELKRGGKRQQT